jgi:hypothetical protein
VLLESDAVLLLPFGGGIGECGCGRGGLPWPGDVEHEVVLHC